jgi:hypothetical protein
MGAMATRAAAVIWSIRGNIGDSRVVVREVNMTGLDGDLRWRVAIPAISCLCWG